MLPIKVKLIVWIAMFIVAVAFGYGFTEFWDEGFHTG